MSRVAITPERYQMFLDAFMSLGNRPNAVAKRIGCDASTAKRAWEKGWPQVPYGAPIARVYADAIRRLDTTRHEAEKKQWVDLTRTQAESRESAPCAKDSELISSRAAESALRPSAAAILQQSALDATQTEVDLLQAFRCNLIGAVSVSNRVLRGLEALAGAAAENAIITAQNVAQVTPERALRPLERFARIIDILSASTKSVIEMQRLLVGAPQQITEQRAADTSELHDRMRRAKQVIDQLGRSGLLPPDVAGQNELTQYEGEESNTHSRSVMADTVIEATEALDDSQRSDNTEPKTAV
jgi:hypothetical protein